LKQLPKTDWEFKQQMRMNDPAHKLKIFIAHNALPDIKPGAGSSIFFHIWRNDGAKPSAGCTVMAEPNLRTLIAWLQPAKHPVYVLLPQSVYDQARSAWGLP
jgi:L,D-peptidoglycan transpeptidase YkuD (ErfK/YbiS/YcfS/YnhG family)